ncbi:hypothetical protein NC653_037277 [Populus alba x Populus x berolinensis]|uniref:Jacalin-type lectin domain-containing protein n=1 Tax=Populus alba x Populus x berolinensis TaxID=444605 RepID=A0AAD6LEA3_9ROSI|nr:hypothetical protein NC653_037277 [Populus alba x Populus x berolinensis]
MSYLSNNKHSLNPNFRHIKTILATILVAVSFSLGCLSSPVLSRLCLTNPLFSEEAGHHHILKGQGAGELDLKVCSSSPVLIPLSPDSLPSCLRLSLCWICHRMLNVPNVEEKMCVLWLDCDASVGWVLINWPSEHLTSIGGTYDYFSTLSTITSLSFTTNRATYGPFGTGSGTPFSIPINNNTVVGFHGTAEHYLDAIGIFVKPETTI